VPTWSRAATAVNAFGLKSAKLTTVDAEALGDRVFEIGRAELLVDSGETVTVKYVVQWSNKTGIGSGT
jgi:hypothetical protein